MSPKYIYKARQNLSFDNFLSLTIICLKKKKLCIPNYFIYELLVCEDYRNGLIGYFGVVMTLGMLHEYFYWPKLKKRCTKNL